MCRYGHVNNSTYSLISDSIVNTYLIRHCGLEPYQNLEERHVHSHETSDSPPTSSRYVMGFAVASAATYFEPTSFPSLLKVRIRVIYLGRSSVRYEVGIFEAKGDDENSEHGKSDEGNKAAVVCQLVHVFVDRTTRRPVKSMPEQLRAGLKKLKVDGHYVDGTKSSML
jgi:acyl-CoA thioester hydrolase